MARAAEISRSRGTVAPRPVLPFPLMTSRRFLPILLVLFVGSGCAALVYEVVWFQLLELVIGSSSVSMAVLLATFMGGMCLGSLLLPRVVSRSRHPLQVYAVLELGIGLIAALELVVVPLVGGVYTAWAGPGAVGLVLRGLVAGLCLLPPTLLMGATLPALARWVETTPQGVSWLGFFYAGNTAGAVIGSVLAGFYLLRFYDMATATSVAVAINTTVAACAWLVSRFAPRGTRADDDRVASAASAASPAIVYVVVGLSGMTALAAEVIWTRQLSLLFGGTTYAFSLILAAFLLGLGIGSGGGSSLARHLSRPRTALAWCQALLCAAIAWAALALTESLPYWPIDPSLAPSPWINFHLDFVRSIWVVLPGAILWGATFPLALAAAVRPGEDPGRVVGTLYAANTVGAIVGSLGASLLVASIGSQHAQQVMVALCAVSGLLALTSSFESEAAAGGSKVGFSVSLAAVTIAGAAFVYCIHPIPGVLVAFGRWAPTRSSGADIIYVGEGYNASVAVSRLANGVLNYHNAGKIQASSEPQDMRLQRMLGHLTTLVPTKPRSVLVIGCGAGVTAGAVSVDPHVEKVTIAEIEPLVPKTVSTYFAAHNFDVVRNPKVHVQIDDGRHFLQTTRETFDGITSDPLDPWVKGAAMLYTREFWELAKQHLNPGGVVTVFVQLYESSEAGVKSEIATFFEAFPNGVVFGNTLDGSGYDLVLLGTKEPLRIDVDAMEARLQSPAYSTVAMSLNQIGARSALALLGTYAGHARDLKPWLRDAAINRDRDLRLQYLAGLGLNLREQGLIYTNMLAHRQFPDDVFVGSNETLGSLRQEIEARGSW